MNNSTFHFVVESMEIENGKKLKSVKPDEKGYYDLPIGVLGEPNRHGVHYDPNSFKRCLVDPESRFNILINEKNLYGEYGHPFTESIDRTMEVFEDKISHHIKKVYSGPKLPTGGTLIMAKIKPHGPYGSNLKENIEDPDMNTAFSLRAISEQKVDFNTGKVTRYMKYLITFDYVHGSGYKAATKQYTPTNESFNGYSFEVKREDFFNSEGNVISVEHITDKDILNIFGAKSITINRQENLLRFDGNSTLFNSAGNKTSLLYEILKNK